VLLGLSGFFTVVIGGEWAYLNRNIDQSRLEIDRPVKANVMLDMVDRILCLGPEYFLGC
jgi:hypothetical protein